MSNVVKVAFKLSDGRIYELNTNEMVHHSITLLHDEVDFETLLGEVVRREYRQMQVDVHMVFNVTDASVWMESDPEELPEATRCHESKRLPG